MRNATQNHGYRGRFAPSPTGRLHFGSLVTALASHVDARAHDGIWLVRDEDLDQTRAKPGMAEQILRDLEAFGLAWDEAVMRQSQRDSAYEEALHRLRSAGLAFPCGCSRKEIAALGRPGPEGPIYPGTCRDGLAPDKLIRSWRLRVPDETLGFADRIQGYRQQNLATEVGDFVVRRADGYFAYQLAVVVDDAEQEITHVVRGADLLASTPRQIHLQRALDLPTPDYAHVPLVLDDQGRKLSKRDLARPVDPGQPEQGLRAAWRFLSQTPPPKDCRSTRELLDWMIAHWRIENLEAKA